MLRPLCSYVLTGIILLAQTGLPLHMHYCKGMLESVAVFVSAECDKQDPVSNVLACCKKQESKSCHKDDSCCDDEVTVLLQDFDSLIPHFEKWIQPVTSDLSLVIKFNANHTDYSLHFSGNQSSDSGPPIYIRFHSLIYYA